MITNIYAHIQTLDDAGHETAAQELWERVKALKAINFGKELSQDDIDFLINGEGN